MRNVDDKSYQVTCPKCKAISYLLFPNGLDISCQCGFFITDQYGLTEEDKAQLTTSKEFMQMIKEDKV